MTAPLGPADWYPDPAGRFQLRYWDGRNWTGHVATEGNVALDLLDRDDQPRQGDVASECDITSGSGGELTGASRTRWEEVAQLRDRGHAYYAQGDLERALEHYRRALEIAQAIAPRSAKTAALLGEMGVVYQVQDDLERALEHYRRALEIAQAIAPRADETRTLLSNIGFVYRAEGDLERALRHYLQALEIDDAVAPHSTLTAVTLNNVAHVYRDKGDLGRALEHYGRALEIAQAIAPRATETATLLSNVGSVYESQGDRERALGYFRRALAIEEVIAPHSSETATRLNNIGLVYLDQGDLQRALEHYGRALEILEAIDARSTGTATVLDNIGSVYLDQGDLAGSLEHYRRALAIYEAVDPRSVETAGDLQNVGVVYRKQGDLERALEHYRRALEIHEALDFHSTDTARILSNVGRVYQDQGDMEGALEQFRRALDVVQAIAPLSTAMALALNNLGHAYQDQGDLERALEHYRRALEIVQPVFPRSKRTATALNNIGSLYHAQGDLERALEHYRRALEIDEAIAPRSVETARDLTNIGSLYHAQGDLERALEHCRRALEIAQTVAPNSSRTAQVLNQVGSVYDAQGDVGGALEHYQLALDIHQAVAPHSSDTAISLNNLGCVCYAQGDLDRAIEHLEAAVAVAESVRARAGGGRTKEAVFGAHQSPYQALIATLFERSEPGDHERAFHYAERSRARALVELLAEREIEVSPETPEQEALLVEERRLRSRLAATYNRLAQARQDGKTPPESLVALAGDERELEDQLDRLRDAIRAAFPAYAEIRYPEPLDLPHVQARLDPNTLMVAYDATGEDTFVWIVGPDRFAMAPLGVTATQLEAVLESALGAYRQGEEGGEEATDAQRELSRILLHAVPAEAFAGATRLVVVPDGALSYLPFELLPLAGGGLLGERYPVSYAPSATVLDNLRELHEGRASAWGRGEFVGFGDPAFWQETDGGDEGADSRRMGLGGALPPLPGTREEVEGIARGFGERATVYLGEAATEHRAKSATAGYRFVHFATHGRLDDHNPLYSGLALAPPTAEEQRGDEDLDDTLQVYEMFGLRLGAEVVVCSACQTGLGTIRAGEGLVGMSRALFFAGARCVVVSLWPVPDRPTARLMERFYEFLRDGVSPAVALQQAKASVRRTHPEVYADPYTWAAFIPVGLG